VRCGLSPAPDGLGDFRRTQDACHGAVDVRVLPEALGTPAAEWTIREAAVRLNGHDVTSAAVPPVSVERSITGLVVMAPAVDGVVLADLLDGIEKQRLTLPRNVALDLATGIVRAVASVHRSVPSFAHGALSPAHVTLTAAGDIRLTDAVYGNAIELLQRNREALWREFGLALPPSATPSRFDQHADATQMGAIVLAVLLGRPLHPQEYPGTVTDLVMTAGARIGSKEPRSISGAPAVSSLVLWLQQALQVHSRAVFRSAVEAEAAWMAWGSPARRVTSSVQAVVRDLRVAP